MGEYNEDSDYEISILCLRSKIIELNVNRGTISGYEDPTPEG